MKSSTGHWVVGDDFFNREGELKVLESRVRDGNHLVMTGQRRMGKTSILRELGRRLERKGWVFLFADVEADRDEEDVITSLAKACHPITPITSRLVRGMRRRLDQEDGARRVDEFLSWLRAVFQTGDDRLPTLIVSGSIGLAPLVERLGISDRVNYLDPVRLGPWSLEVSVRCFEALMKNYRLVDDPPRLVTDTLAVLVHDEYIEPHPDGHRFRMNLLRDWWKARFRHHYTPLSEDRTIGFRENDAS